MLKPAELYQTYVIAHGLERAGLFESLRERYGQAASVLYPGCFLHVTPSFCFQHAVYMDKNELAADFFADVEGMLHLINSRKQYPQRPYVRFIQQDFTKPLPLPEVSFDLLLALYAGGISRSCAGYLKSGGILVSNDHHGDAAEAAASKELELIAAIMEHRETYEFIEKDLDGYLLTKKPRRGAAGTQHTLGRPEYERTAHYYVFRKRSPGHRRS
ncbi:MAG TPA: hypothetical protein VNA24_07400 [Hyalangium sp.]|nr:hypothetical protein [Hyalangium sp.]